MPRSRRVEYPHAFYHVMNRGRNKDNIFHDSSYFQLFLDIIDKASTRFNLIVHCYCLMNNHYHLLLETPDANLSKIMRFVGREYVEKYNRKNGCDGSLFKGRYKSVLVDKDSYLSELTRYIHRNPLCIVDNLKNYQWSSYPAYLNESKTPSWLNKETTLKILGCKNVESYVDFVETNRDKEIYNGRKNIPSIMGNDEFKKVFFRKNLKSDSVPFSFPS